MKKNHIKNTPSSLGICRLFVIPLAIAIVPLSIAPDAFAENSRSSTKASRVKIRMVAGYARFENIDGESLFTYGAKFIMREPVNATLTPLVKRELPHIKSIAGIPSSRDDCTTMIEVREMTHRQHITEITQKCTRTNIPADDLDFHLKGSTVAVEYKDENNGPNGPVTGAQFLTVVGF